MKKDEYKNLKTSKQIIQRHLDSAKERIGSAEILLEKGNFRDAVSRSYYAFLDAARAALLTKNKTAKTHAGVLTLFGLEFGKTKLVPSYLFRFYQQILRARGEADYELLRKFSKEETKDAVKKAKEFINFIEKNIIK